MKTLTGMSGIGSAREFAEMLRQLGRGRDTVLAHITPEEAQMLMDMGGSGSINPNTGLPEFQEEFDIGFGPGRYTPDYTAQDVQGAPYEDMGQFYSQPSDFYGSIDRNASVFDQVQQLPPGLRYQTEIPVATRRVDITEPVYREPFSMMERADLSEFAAPAQPSTLESIEKKLGNVEQIFAKYPKLAQAAGYTAKGLAGLIFSARARSQGQKESQKLRALAEPLRSQGEALRQQALTGTLSPQEAAREQAARARAMQSGASRGVTSGTQRAMIETQLAQQRAQSMESKLNNAVKLLNLANAYDEEAIRMSMQSDREADRLLGEIFASLGTDVAQAGAQAQAQNQQRQPVTRRPEVKQGAA